MRRKLFGEIVSDGQKIRRSLFSNSSRRKLFSDTEKICQDCGKTVSERESVCPNCGGSRFNYLSSKNCSCNDSIEYIFSEIKNSKRRSLFSDSDKGIQKDVSIFICPDCGYEFQEEGETPTGLRCPNCGGNRVVKKDSMETDESIDDTPETCDATDETLKEFSGCNESFDKVEKTFSDRGIDLAEIIESGYAKYNSDDDTVCFSENADAIRKLFSRLVISVTKELELDPVDSKEALIHNLEESPSMTPKAIIMIKKAHGIMPIDEPYHGSDSDSEDYIEDSGLKNDLKLVHGDSEMSLSELNNLIKSQYNDAPDDILDKLVNSGIIDINGSTVKINK